jgi:hypothetical protein
VELICVGVTIRESLKDGLFLFWRKKTTHDLGTWLEVLQVFEESE